MPAKKGDNLGGVHTLRDLRDRCVIDVVTRCWQWRGAVSPGRGRNRETRVWYPALQRILPVPRVSWLLAGKGELEGRTVWRCCGEELCVNPDHLMAGSKAEWGRWMAERGSLSGRPDRSAANRAARIASGHTPITMEIAAWVRESPQSGVEVAHAVGVQPTAITRLRKGRTFAPVACASVFNLGSLVRADRRKAA